LVEFLTEFEEVLAEAVGEEFPFDIDDRTIELQQVFGEGEFGFFFQADGGIVAETIVYYLKPILPRSD
jgi:hypothetical protein